MRVDVNTDKNIVFLGELVRFNIEFFNDEATDIKDLEFYILPCIGTMVIPRSIEVGGDKLAKGSYSRISLGNLKKNETISITYVQKIEVLTGEKHISFKGRIKYKSLDNSSEKNLLLKRLKLDILKLNLKVLDVPSDISLNDLFKIKLSIKNIGTVNIKDIELLDFWSDFCNLQEFYINDSNFKLGENKIKISSLKKEEEVSITLVLKLREIDASIMTLLPKISFKYLREDLIYEEKFLDFNGIYIYVHCCLVKNFEKSSIIYMDKFSLSKLYYYNIFPMNFKLIESISSDTNIAKTKKILILTFLIKLRGEDNMDRINLHKKELNIYVVLPNEHKNITQDELVITIVSDSISIKGDDKLEVLLDVNIYKKLKSS